MDDGMSVSSEQRRRAEERHWGEQDVRDAFERWNVSDKARKKLKSPRSIDLRRYMQPRDKGPRFEKVDGAVLDTRPGGATGPYGMEETLPEIEAHDIVDIPSKVALNGPAMVDAETDQGTLSSLTSASSTQSSGTGPQVWSESSRSTSSTASTDHSSPQPYQHVTEEYRSLNDDDPEIFKQVMGSPQGVHLATSAAPSSLHSSQLQTSPQQPTKLVKAEKLPLEVINEESRDSLVISEELDAATPPTVPGVKDEEVTVQTPNHASLKEKIMAPFTEHTKSADHDMSPTRVLGASGIGPDQHVYELEAAVPADVKMSRADIDENPSEVDAGHPHGLLDKVEHGVSRVVHALHEKVRKNVTFSQHNDVRFMTPSPYPPSMDSNSAVDVDMTR